MHSTTRTLVVAAVALLPLSVLHGQAGNRRGRAPADPTASDLIGARRDLNLTPQQLVRLDSIERAHFAARDQAASVARAARDSACANRRPCALGRDEMQSLRTTLSQRGQRSLAADSARRALTMNVLDSTQRARFTALRQTRGRNAQGGMKRDRQGVRGRSNAPRGGRSNFRAPRSGFRSQPNDVRRSRGQRQRGGFGRPSLELRDRNDSARPSGRRRAPGIDSSEQGTTSKG